jgi:hypothetical protein
MHVRRALALTAVVPLLLAGCSEEEPEPRMPDPPSSSSTTPSPTPSETVEAESAEDFIRRWADVMREMQASGDTEEFRDLGPDCESCTATADRIEAIYAGGGSVEWDGWTILDVGPNGESPDEYRVKVLSAPTRYRETAGGTWQTIEGGRSTRLLQLKQVDGGWLIARTAEMAE